MTDRPAARSPRWPAYAVALVFTAYAIGKAVYATQSRLGLPTGPDVSAAAEAGYFADPALAQWLAAANGVLGVALALATVGPLGRRLPRPLMLTALWIGFAAFGAGAGTMVVDGFIGIGVGWRWYHGVLGAFALYAFAAMIRSYTRATRRVR